MSGTTCRVRCFCNMIAYLGAYICNIIAYLGNYQEVYMEACWVAEVSAYMCVYDVKYIPYTVGVITETIVTHPGLI